MKKTELIGCPKWLLHSDTENEDVDFDEYGILIWRGGNFMGGNFRGGNFWSGNFMGESLSRAPISIYGLKNWYVQITPSKMHIGANITRMQNGKHLMIRKFPECTVMRWNFGA